MNKKILIITALLVVTLLATNFIFFASLSITTNLTGASGTIDNKVITLPYKGFVRTGSHHLSIKLDGYAPIREDFKIKPGRNNKNILLKTYKESYIEKLPYVTDSFEIEYNQKDNFFYVLVKSEPYEATKISAIKEIQSNNINTTTEKIVWDAIAGVNNKVGP